MYYKTFMDYTKAWQPIILEVYAKKTHKYSFVFYKSENNVWLTGKAILN